jgi:hypothetical protein
LIIPYKHDKIPLFRFPIPLFQHSIIPGWKKKNGWVAIPHYQAFLEVPIHELRFAALTIGIMECWKNGIMGWRPSGKKTPAAMKYNCCGKSFSFRRRR